jgi:hypothetical protein
LKFAEQRASKLAEDNRKLAGELSQSASRIQGLEKSLEDSKGSYEKLKDDAKARYLEAQQVLKKRNEKITELQEEVESLKKSGAEPRQSSRATRAKSFDEKATNLKSLQTAEEGSARLLKGLKELKQRTRQKGAGTSAAAAPDETRQREKHSTGISKRPSHDDATLAQARALREKLEAEFGTKGLPASSVFGDRGNLQDSRSSASSGRSAHSHEEEPHPTGRLERPSRSTWAATATEKATLSDLLAESREKTARKTSLEQLKRKPPARPLSPESDVSPDVAGTDAQSGGSGSVVAGPGTRGSTSAGAVWNSMNASRAALPEHRKAAALARIQRRIAERKLLQQLGRDKENARPG